MYCFVLISQNKQVYDELVKGLYRTAILGYQHNVSDLNDLKQGGRFHSWSSWNIKLFCKEKENKFKAAENYQCSSLKSHPLWITRY